MIKNILRVRKMSKESNSRRKRYSEDFKKEVVRLIEKESYSLGEASLRFGIGKSTLSKWKRLFGHNTNSESMKSEGLTLFEQKQLQKELSRTKEERDILKKALAYFAQSN